MASREQLAEQRVEPGTINVDEKGNVVIGAPTAVAFAEPPEDDGEED
jgi:hypothetical protein